MKSRKGITLIEILILIVVCFFLLVLVGGGCLMVKGCNMVEQSFDDATAAHASRLVSNPPIYAVGDIVYHKATDAKMVVAKNSSSWNDVKEGWNMKVKNGGNWDQVGGKSVNETEVKLSLKEVDK